jgi:hypothetical protein
MKTSLELLTAIASENPWSGDYDNDWCHYCYAQPEYGPKPWKGHRENCLWLEVCELVNRLGS